ncbi:MAG TPA: hypothetical protein VGQ82_09895 [Chthoniobacterales bacterium]|nr:hypothetical protein [Chthoniobacterales bacterium]
MSQGTVRFLFFGGDSRRGQAKDDETFVRIGMGDVETSEARTCTSLKSL